METRTLKIDGMSCGHCVARVNKTLGTLPGVSVEDVQVGSARINLDPATTPMSTIGDALADIGFTLRSDEAR